MDETLKSKLDEARERIQTKYARINSEIRASKEQKEAWLQDVDADEKDVAGSLTEEDREEVRTRIKELAPKAAVPVKPRVLDSNAPVQSIEWEIPDEYYFLRRLAQRWE